MSESNFGHVKVSMCVCHGTDTHGREIYKFVSVLNHYCEQREAPDVLDEFLRMNPHIAKAQYRAEFVMRNLIRGIAHVGLMS
jgi:hypothetical protein